MVWQRLQETKVINMYRGSRIRIELENVSDLAEDSSMDFMVFDSLQGDSIGMSLIRISGYKAGHILVTFPKESCITGTRSLSTQWLKENSESAFPFGSSISSIWITEKKLTAKKHLP